MRLRSWPALPLVLAAVLVVPASAPVAAVAPRLAQGSPPRGGPPPPDSSATLRAAVTVSGIRAHQAALQAIADAHGGNRLAGTAGYDASAAYVRERALAAGYDVRIQEFQFVVASDRTPPLLRQAAPADRAFAESRDFDTLQYSGSGDVAAPLVAVDMVVPVPAPNASTSGCEAADFAAFPAGTIALVQRGTCTFRAKVENAAAAGAAAVIVVNDGGPGRSEALAGTLGPPVARLPAVGAAFGVGEQLRNGMTNGPTGVTVRLRTDTTAEERTARNVVAETRSGDPGSVVVAGAHLDSVGRGPGINDDGSGSAVLLEIAEAMAGVQPHRRVRFIWFGAEEEGLLGSTHYVGKLTNEERTAVALMLNLDMVGSPNFVRFVYDGDASHTRARPGGLPAGSAEVERAFLDHFAAQGLATTPAALDGGSDHGPFLAAGIPAGGVFAGATGSKTPEQAAVYGGEAGVPYDACYHQACDTYAGTGTPLALQALDQMSDAVAHVVISFAQGTLPMAWRGRD